MPIAHSYHPFPRPLEALRWGPETDRKRKKYVENQVC